MADGSKSTISNSIVNYIFKILLNDPSAVLNLLFDIFQRFPLFKELPGMYEVLRYESELELKDSKGRTAVFTKRQRVRFLQNNIIAYQDKAWGDGDIFVDYHCTPGVEVDRYRDGHRYNILISLRETKHRGEEETFLIERTIRDGFTQAVEEFQTDIDHRTHHLILKLVFPKSRLPTKVSITAQNKQITTRLDTSRPYIRPDGKHQYVWETHSPKLFEAYIIRWEW
jgi:hypothetical protein